jgi:hypothetical protein
MAIRIDTRGRLTWFASDEYFRPSLWIDLPHSQIVIFFGWQWPTLLWL